MTIVACLFFSCIRTYAFSTSMFGLPVDEVTSVGQIIKNYCTQVLKTSPFVEGGFVYNAQQSAFVHLLCRNFDHPSTYFANNEDSYFKLKDFKEL